MSRGGAWYEKARAGRVASASALVARFSFSCRGSEMSGVGGTFWEGMFPKYFLIQASVSFESNSPVTTIAALLGA